MKTKLNNGNKFRDIALYTSCVCVCVCVALQIKHDANHLMSCTKVPEKTHIQILFDVNSKRKFFTALSKLM